MMLMWAIILVLILPIVHLIQIIVYSVESVIGNLKILNTLYTKVIIFTLFLELELSLKDHITSFALLSEEKRDEFLQVLNDIKLILQGIYKKKVFAFECSSGKTGAGKHKTSIVHAHFHLAPTEMPVLREVQKSGLHPSLISKHEWGKYGENPYMLYIDQDDNWFIADDPNDYYPRQHPRQVLAEWMDATIFIIGAIIHLEKEWI